MKHYKLGTMTYSVAHFCVDFACAFLMFRSGAAAGGFIAAVILYNFCAFALQMPFGAILDRLNRNSLFACLGCALVALSSLCMGVPLLLVTLAGLGNALFHVGGGIDVLNGSEHKCGALGVFVSPGAFGIYFGTILGKGQDLSIFVPVGLVLISAALLPLLCGPIHSRNADVKRIEPPESGEVGALLLLFAVVMLRSFVGLIQSFPWKSQGSWGLILVCAVVLGKTAGGFLADFIGIKRAAVISLGLSVVLYLFSANPYAGVTAVFLFNMSMPMTLWAAAKILYNLKGFAFGMLTLALFIGYLPAQLGLGSSLTQPWVYAVFTAISLVLLYFGVRRVASRA
ncbi:MAG TPA: hypothetical protein P5116_00480 [Eubacteriales bacterium]|nr:hypothetical protein [Clostridia bacterium]HRV72340.1 hypothetical protein [Eubacteriales bacterium]